MLGAEPTASRKLGNSACRAAQPQQQPPAPQEKKGVERFIYRHVTVGSSLVSALEDLIEQGVLTECDAKETMEQFERSMDAVLTSGKFDSRGEISGSLRSYNFCDSVWQFDVGDLKLSVEGEDAVTAKSAKIVCCDEKVTTTS